MASSTMTQIARPAARDPSRGRCRRRRCRDARRRTRLARPARERLRGAPVPERPVRRSRLRDLEQLLVRRAATASSPTASSTTRSPRCSGSSCSRSRASPRPRSRSGSSPRVSGGRPSRWSNRSFAVVWAGVVLSGAFPFALGIALALLALWALQAGGAGRSRSSRCSSLAASPVAFVLLAVILAGIGLSRAPRRSELALPLDDARAAAAVELVLLAPLPRRRPLPVLAARVRGRLRVLWARDRAHLAGGRGRRAALDVRRLPRRVHRRVPRSVEPRREHRPAPLRGDSDRDPDALAAPLAAAAHRALRTPLAVAWNLTPLAGSFVKTSADPAANAAYWAPAVGFLREHLSPSYRVEAVDTVGHWPAAYLPAAGIPIARGWFRQDDFPRNDLLYAKLDRTRYLAWLRSLGVRYVVLPDAPLDYSAKQEAALIAGGASGLRRCSARRTRRSTPCRHRADRDGAGPRRGARVRPASDHGRGRRAPAATASPRTGRPTGRRVPAASRAARTAPCD